MASAKSHEILYVQISYPLNVTPVISISGEFSVLSEWS